METGKAAPFRIKPIALLKPVMGREISVINLLGKRKTTREISERKLSLQVISNLVWAACGVNRKKGPFGAGGRTAASASNSQEIDIYVAMEEGIYLYNPVDHVLYPAAEGDYRELAIGQGQLGMGAKAPLRFIYVADIDKLINTKGFMEPGLLNPEVQKSYYYADTGLIAGNVYLYAASAGLAAWFHNCNRKKLEGVLNLKPGQVAVFGQTVGYPGKKSSGNAQRVVVPGT
jgi:Nitroreductase family